MTTTIENRINELSIELTELNRQKENLKFLKENNFTNLINVADELESKYETLYKEIQAVIDHQMDKDPRQKNEKEKEIWFGSTLSKMIRMNQLMIAVIQELKTMQNN
jgi:hypothetical protein